MMMARILRTEMIAAIGTGRKDYSTNAENNIIPVIRSHQLRYRWGLDIFNVDPTWFPVGVVIIYNSNLSPPYTWTYQVPDNTFYMDSFQMNTDKNSLIKIELVQYPSEDAAFADADGVGSHATADAIIAVKYGYGQAEIVFDAGFPLTYGKAYSCWIWPHGSSRINQTTSFNLNAHGIRDVVVQR